jgi:hypothetical protein
MVLVDSEENPSVVKASVVNTAKTDKKKRFESKKILEIDIFH